LLIGKAPYVQSRLYNGRGYGQQLIDEDPLRSFDTLRRQASPWNLKMFLQSKFIKNILYQLTKLRVRQKIEEVIRYLNKHDKILDIGAGNCVVYQILTEKNFKLMPLDVRSVSFVEGVEPVLYNGKELPFEHKEFDTAMLLTMLHHTKDPENILREARRVSRKLIIIEEIYTNKIQKFLTFFIDSVFNLEFFGHPHSNRTDEEWKQTFGRLDLELLDVRYSRSFFVLKRATYFLGC